MTTAVIHTLDDDGVGTILLNRPEVRNAFSRDLATGLSAAMHDLVDRGVRAIVVAGEGPAFCVGGDLQSFDQICRDGRLVEQVSGDLLTFNPVVRALFELPCPTVAALHGAVAGGGLGLAAACDLRVCAPTTVFAPGFGGIGLPPDTGTSWLLPRLMGVGRAADFLLRNQRLDAAEALAAGLVTELDDDPRTRADTLAHELAAGPVRGLATTKELLASSLRLEFGEQLDAEARRVLAALHGDELGEGIASFVEKRPPRFPAVDWRA